MLGLIGWSDTSLIYTSASIVGLIRIFVMSEVHGRSVLNLTNTVVK